MSAELSELDRRLDEIELTEKVKIDPLNEPSLHDVALLGMDSINGFVKRLPVIHLFKMVSRAILELEKIN